MFVNNSTEEHKEDWSGMETKFNTIWQKHLEREVFHILFLHNNKGIDKIKKQA
jgi:hypothetical protein